MRIISKFKDYYDIGLDHSQDNECLYKRETVVKVEGYLYKSRRYNKENAVHKAIIGFCGKIYPFVRLRLNNYKTLHYDSNQEYQEYYCYSRIDLESAFQKHSIPIVDENKDIYFVENIISLSRYLEGETVKDNKLLFEEFDCPIFYTERRTKKYHHDITEDALILNPCLRDYQFYKVFDAYSAYQELDMYINMEEPDMAQVDDKYRYQGHGYNKESFRMPKGTKKPRRKKKGIND